MKLSILICTIPSRLHLLKALLDVLGPQLTPDVEVLYLGDDKKRSIGCKRNDLLSIARGEFVAFIDDDDMVTHDYVGSILEALKSNPNCVVFQTMTHRADTGTHKRNLVGIQYDRIETDDLVTCPPTHTMVWRRSMALDHDFKDVSEGEDVCWVDRICKGLFLSKQASIDKVLYHYNYDPKVSERP